MKLKLRKDNRKEISDAKTVSMETDDKEGLVGDIVMRGRSSIIGARKNQQDACFTDQIRTDCTIGIVCDGMGGLEDGATASKTAIEYVAGRMCEIDDITEINEILEMIAEDADEIVADLKDDTGRNVNAGTTLAAVMITGNHLHWVSVGDSKIFILRNGALQCVTDQHNYRFMAEKRKNRRGFVFDPNVRQDALVSYIGAGGLPYIDISPDDVILGDRDMVLICSDGLYNALPEPQIREIMLEDKQTVSEIAHRLTSEVSAKKLRGQDNATAVVLQYRNKL